MEEPVGSAPTFARRETGLQRVSVSVSVCVRARACVWESEKERWCVQLYVVGLIGGGWGPVMVTAERASGAVTAAGYSAHQCNASERSHVVSNALHDTIVDPA